jgi:hypothetical protein
VVMVARLKEHTVPRHGYVRRHDAGLQGCHKLDLTDVTHVSLCYKLEVKFVGVCGVGGSHLAELHAPS